MVDNIAPPPCNSKVLLHAAILSTFTVFSISSAKVKGTDGSEKEIKIDPDEVDPSNASYVEMLALSAHLKQQGKIDSPAGGIVAMTMAKRVQEANARQGEIYDKSNFLSEMQNTLEDCLKNGLMDTYMRKLMRF